MIAFQDPTLTVLQGDWLSVASEIPDESIHCIVTSPPYWGLRDYGIPPSVWGGDPVHTHEFSQGFCGCGAWLGAFGLEPTPELYIAHAVLVFREVRRVLRGDGTLWLNIGDSYAQNGGPGWQGKTGQRADRRFTLARNTVALQGCARSASGSLKPKDLVGIPWMLAFALRADGWYLRSDIIWHKPNPMPESTTDRPTKSHEYLFLLTKSEHYFYDAEAIREKTILDPRDKQWGKSETTSFTDHSEDLERGMMQKRPPGFVRMSNPSGRNKRSVWTVPTAPFKGSHFATFPPALITPPILAGTSAYGCCADCGAPWERVIEKGAPESTDGTADDYRPPKATDDTLIKGRSDGWTPNHVRPTSTTGWRPTCECHGKLVRGKVTIPARISKEQALDWGADSNGEYNGKSVKDHPEGIQDASELKRRIIENATMDREVNGWIYLPDIPLDQHPVKPCTVGDPFLGSGTTAMVANQLGLAAVGAEMNPDYIKLIMQRTKERGLALI